jgi:type IV pilus assembly protein PilM
MFRFRKPYFLGLDFGTSLVKAIELTEKDGKILLSDFGQVSLVALERGVPASSNRTYDDEVVLYLRALLDRMQPKSREVYVAMPAFIGLISLLEFPEMKESELQEAIQFEAHKYIPSPLEEVALSWEVVNRIASDDGHVKTEVLLVAALNKEVEHYENNVHTAGLDMKLLELETFSIVRALIGDAPGLRLIVDIGARSTNLILVDNGVVRVSRNLDIGGKDVTRTLVEGLNITSDRAEILKKSDKDFLNNPESALIFPALQMIQSESERILESYHTKYPDVVCQEVILSGGTAQMAGLVKYYSASMQLPVSIGNPWARVEYDESLSATIRELGTSFTVAIGLALGGLDAAKKKKAE